jgi:hypothetical protein
MPYPFLRRAASDDPPIPPHRTTPHRTTPHHTTPHHHHPSPTTRHPSTTFFMDPSDHDVLAGTRAQKKRHQKGSHPIQPWSRFTKPKKKTQHGKSKGRSRCIRLGGRGTLHGSFSLVGSIPHTVYTQILLNSSRLIPPPWLQGLLSRYTHPSLYQGSM